MTSGFFFFFFSCHLFFISICGGFIYFILFFIICDAERGKLCEDGWTWVGDVPLPGAITGTPGWKCEAWARKGIKEEHGAFIFYVSSKYLPRRHGANSSSRHG
jgi:hypothetical protein